MVQKCHQVTAWLLNTLRLKLCGSHLRWKIANKHLDVHEQAEVVERNKENSSLPLLSHGLPVFAKKAR